MSKLEVQSFVVSATNYFKYVHRAANEQVRGSIILIFCVVSSRKQPTCVKFAKVLLFLSSKLCKEELQAIVVGPTAYLYCFRWGFLSSTAPLLIL